jgi:hypothetical protein
VIGAAMLLVALVLLLSAQLFERAIEKKLGGAPL